MQIMKKITLDIYVYINSTFNDCFDSACIYNQQNMTKIYSFNKSFIPYMNT